MPDTAAFEWNGATVARERFYRIACDPRRSVAVEACAGAGKTWMLVSRMVRALLLGAAPQDILAITFTKKAAGEMRQRLQEWLHQFSSATDAQLQSELRMRGFAQPATAEQLHTLRGLHTALLHGGRPVQIRTFHSWFAALLRTAPLGVLHSLGLPSAYQLLEDDKQATALVWRRFQTRIAKEEAARTDYAQAVQTYGRFNAHKALESALSKRTEFALADAQGVVEQSVDPFARQFPDFAAHATPDAALRSDEIRALLQRVASILGAQKGAKCQQAASALERALTEGRDADIADALLTQKGEPRKLGDKFAQAEVVQQAQDFLLRLNQARLQHAAWLHQQRMARLSRILLDEYAQLKREHGWIDMGDLERAALVLLRDEELSGWVQERLDARVRHLLIDEFQDTNPLQWQALHAWLSGYAGAGNAPSVFIVGDPKQSIYRFRRAEPQVFRAAKAFVQEGLGGDLLSCDHTRRNAQAVIATVNAVMAEAQERQEFEGFRQHTSESLDAGQVLQLPAIEPMESRDTEARQAWRDSLTQPRFEEEESRKVLECRQAALWLQSRMQASGGTLAPKDVMVLARKRERLGLMQAELAALGIPAQQPEKSDLIDFAEVQDVVALLDALVSPQHDLSLARALKSPLFCVSDADLVQLALQRKTMQVATPKGSTTSWMQVLQSGASLPQILQTSARQLALWKTWVDSMPPHDALSAIYQSGDVLARFAAAAPANQRDGVVANLQAVLHAALAVDGGRYITAYRLVRALRAGGNKAPVRSDSGAMRLLTIHGAKGLEAPLVLLLDTDAREARAETMGALVDWPGEAAFPRRFIFLASESNPPACVVDALHMEQAERSREELNALYVALTRTQQTLVISSVVPRSANPASWWAQLVPHAQSVDVEPAESGLSTESTGTDQVAVGFVMPTLPELPTALRWGENAGGSARPQPEADSVESRVGQAMHRLLELLPVRAGGYGRAETPWPESRTVHTAQAFALDAQHMTLAVDMARRIATGDAAWAWDAEQLSFHANEVPLSRGGRLLRIDRLVQLRSSGEWWVLDYKSSAAPQNDAALCDQLLGYRASIAQTYGAATVRAAFLTPQGALIELNTP
ncbi:UvrD-helicase domain-containing protein [Rhodoferax sp. GW822-FHT02A01]|uniref:UvrD-helicase domain-containing protein n=1 Tax=Rhodoferax sp. GW822-FHT02A01 TaxID=3141537 RepID=UPI00315D1477